LVQDIPGLAGDLPEIVACPVINGVDSEAQLVGASLTAPAISPLMSGN
jgi:hypothetical protein